MDSYFPAQLADSDSSSQISKSVATKRIPKCIPKRKKSVRWGSAFTYKSTTNPDDFPTIWYNARDLETFQREKRRVVKALKHVDGGLAALEGTKYVTRGFECYQTVAFNRIIRNQRKAVVQNVLALQQEQLIATGMINDEAIAQAARQETAWARDIALEMGLKDEESVRLGWKEFFANVPMETDSSDSDSSSLSPELLTGNMFDQLHLDQADGVSNATHIPE